MPLEPRSIMEERARAAIESPAEFAGTEFKGNYPFDDLKYRIAKTAMAMANLRDGGQVIVGVSQDEAQNFVRDGVDTTNEQTFVQEPLFEFVNSFASPTVDLLTIGIEYDGKRFVVIAISPFDRTPVVCRRNTPDGTKGADQMREGDFFIRTTSPVGTSRVTSAAMMADLLELATVRRLAEHERLRREAGVPLGAVNQFDEEVGDIADLL